MQVDILINGKPIAKRRPRFFRRGKGVGTYNSQETEEGLWMWKAKSQLTQIPVIPSGPVELMCEFSMPIPSGMCKKDRDLIENFKTVHHVKKPDLDNLIKFVKDCLNGLAWNDDSQVCEISARKYYGKKPCTFIRIKSRAVLDLHGETTDAKEKK